MILGTAGHIDHGKTALVRALTGVDTDRLPEEKRRGITIDLGFAPLELEGVGRVGVVDVPGHEAFVRTMVAGATGVDLALLVIAADSGVMPQTREHLSILSLLGVRGGVVALTKRDLVDDEWLALVEEDVRGVIASSALAGAAIVPVSSTTGEGIDALRAALGSVAGAVPARSRQDLFRLPVDRAFTVKGTGTVVTGTVWTGTLARDASLRLLPAGVTVRVRGLQAHGRGVDAVHAGERAAVALAGVELEQVGRGSVLVQGEGWQASRLMRGDVQLLDDAAVTLGPRSRVRLHLGTNEVGARLVVRGGVLEPGVEASARIVLDEAIVARAGDRFVLRSASPVATIGGGVITDPAAPLRARPFPDRADNAPRTRASTLACLLAESGAAGVDVRELPVRLGSSPGEVAELVAGLAPWTVGNRLVDASVRTRLEESALAIVEGYHGEHPLDPGAPLQWVRSRLAAADEVATAVLDSLSRSGRVSIGSGVIASAAFSPVLDATQAAQAQVIVDAITAAGTEPPSIDELAATVRLNPSTVLTLLRWLGRDGTVVPVEADRYYARSAVEELRSRLAAGMLEPREYTPAELRDFLGLTRKFMIPFLEYCDREGYTIRTGLGRRLTQPRT